MRSNVPTPRWTRGGSWVASAATAHHRAFAYLPFEHDETLASQHESLRLFKQLKAEPDGASYYSSAVGHARIIERFGRLDIGVNNVGYGLPEGGSESLSLEDWNRVFAVNLTGVFLCAREAAERLL